MKLLIDECLSPRVVDELVARGHDAVHVGERGLLSQPDTVVMACAKAEDRVVVSADTDFGELLARSGHPLPSVILLRRRDHDPKSQADVIQHAIDSLVDDIDAGAIVVISDDRIRVRPLPLSGPST